MMAESDILISSDGGHEVEDSSLNKRLDTSFGDDSSIASSDTESTEEDACVKKADDYEFNGVTNKLQAASVNFKFYGSLVGSDLYHDKSAFAMSLFVSNKQSSLDVTPLQPFEIVTHEGKQYVFLAALFFKNSENGVETTLGLCVEPEELSKLIERVSVGGFVEISKDTSSGIIVKILLDHILQPLTEGYEKQLADSSNDAATGILYQMCLAVARDDIATLLPRKSDVKPIHEENVGIKQQKQEKKKQEGKNEQFQSSYNFRSNRGKGVGNKLQDEQAASLMQAKAHGKV
jgi:hypothetical protein